MIEFVKGQWYQNKTTKEYYQCIDIAHNVLLACRRAGQESARIRYGCADDYTPSSLTPDFTNAKVGDECFSAEEGLCKIIMDSTGKLIAAMNEDGGWDAFTKDGKLEPESNHPLLFNSFAQFQAYWAEQALLMATQRRNHEQEIET